MSNSYYELLWSHAEVLVRKLISNKKVFLVSGEYEIIFLFLIAFISAKYVFEDLDTTDFYEWYEKRIDTFFKDNYLEVFDINNILYDNLIYCSKILRSFYTVQAENLNFVYVLTSLVQKRLHSCIKTPDAKIIISRQIASVIDYYISFQSKFQSKLNMRKII